MALSDLNVIWLAAAENHGGIDFFDGWWAIATPL